MLISYFPAQNSICGAFELDESGATVRVCDPGGMRIPNIVLRNGAIQIGRSVNGGRGKVSALGWDSEL